MKQNMADCGEWRQGRWFLAPEHPSFRPMEEMNLLDDFLFGSVVVYPEIGERFVKILLRTVFGREFRHVSVTAQKVFHGVDTDRHGAGLARCSCTRKGTRGVPGDALRQLLRYTEESARENAVNDDLREVHGMVEIVKIDPGTTISCARLTEKLVRSRKQGETKGKAEGKEEKLIIQVCKKMKLGQRLEKIASGLVEDVSAIEPIYHAAEKFAPEYDLRSVLESFGIRNDFSDAFYQETGVRPSKYGKGKNFPETI